jgi:hypothetical protein
MSIAARAHIRLDERGVAWIDDTSTKACEPEELANQVWYLLLR